MTNQEILDAIDAVDEINQIFFEKYDVYHCPQIFMQYSTEIAFSVGFPGIYVEIPLNGTEDDRIYYEETDTYEPYLDYIKRKYTEVLKHINRFEL